MDINDEVNKLLRFVHVTTDYCLGWNRHHESNDFNEDFFRLRKIFIDNFKSDPHFLTSEGSKGKDLMLLPHPMRLTVNGVFPFEMMVPIARPEKVGWAVMKLYQNVACGLSFSQAFGEFFENLPEASEVMSEFNKAGHDSNLGNFQLNLMVYSWILNGRPTFQVDDPLAHALLKTDFAKDTPTSFFRSPLPFCYIEFGQDRNLGITISHDLSGDHQLEGCYVNEYTDHEYIKQMPVSQALSERGIIDLDSDGLRRVELTFVGSPLGKNSVMDDATRDIALVFDDNKSLDIGKVLETHLDIYRNLDAKIAGVKVDPTNDIFASEIGKLIDYLVTVLLFINSSSAVKNDIDELTPLLRSRDNVKNKAKMKKKEKRIRKARQHILISSTEPVHKLFNASKDGAGKSAHWRRGHLRKQPYGEGRSKVKIVFISPTLIGGGDVNPKGYKVR